MKNTQLRFISFCFTIFCLTWGVAPLPLAWGATVIIDTDPGGAIFGNGDGPNGSDAGGDGNLLSANDNEVTINVDVIGNVIGGSDMNTGSVTGNTVTINSGASVGPTVSVWGGQSNKNDGSSVTVTDNSVIIDGGTVDYAVHGGQAGNGGSGSATATGNTVTMNGGTVNKNHIYGGMVSSNGGSATATGNSVTIDGGTVNGNVYGASVTSNGALTTATDNTVTIRGNVTFDASSKLYGGYVNANGGTATSTGNTLNLHSSITVADVQNFQLLNFYLPTAFAAGDTMLTITDTATTIDFSDSTVNVGIDGGSSPLAVNDEITLIDANATTGLVGPLNSTANGQGMQGVTLKYEFALLTENDMLKAIVTSDRLNEQVKALSEGFLAGLILVNQGADLIAGPGMSQGLLAAAESGFGAFGAMAVGQSRYDTGSHIDMSSLALLTGFARGLETAPGRLTLGAFFEYGNGNYDAYNSFATEASVRGDGDADRFGGGLLGRLDFNESNSGHAYVEASGRVGQVENDYRSADLRNAAGRATSFDSSSAYYGLHLGAGYLWDISEETSLDLYAKYFWSGLEGDTVTLSSNDRVEFEDADSHRLRLGSRLSFNRPLGIAPYVGLAWEHEFDGEARGTASGYSIDPPSLKGDTGIGEIGLNIKPSADRSLSFDLGLSGYVGQRQGAMGTLTIKYDF